MENPILDSETRAVLRAARRWKEKRSKWYARASDKNADDWNEAEQRLAEAISAYDKAARIATATTNQGGAA